MEPEATRLLIDDFATRLVEARAGLLRFPITYYYGSRDEPSSLPSALPYLVWLTEEGSRENCPPETRFYAAVLRSAIDHFSVTVATRFPDSALSHRVLQEYSRDHLCERLPGDDARFS